MIKAGYRMISLTIDMCFSGCLLALTLVSRLTYLSGPVPTFDVCVGGGATFCHSSMADPTNASS